MKVTTWDAQAAAEIGHAFGYYDYGAETGMGAFYSSKEAVADYISGYVRMSFDAGILYTAGEHGEGYIAYTLPGQRINLRGGMQLVRALLRSMTPRQMLTMASAISKGGKSLQDRMKKKKKQFIFVGMVCVRENYQGQGFMRKLLSLAFEDGKRLQVPVILETDARSKCDKYRHLGMQLDGVRDLGAYGKLYDLIWYP